MKSGNRQEATGSSKKTKVVGFALCAMLFALCSFAEAQPVKKIPTIGTLHADSRSFLTPLMMRFGEACVSWGTSSDKTFSSSIVLPMESTSVSPSLPLSWCGQKSTSFLQWVAGRSPRPSAPRAQFRSLRVRVIWSGTGWSQALQDPGNITGLTNVDADFSAKRLELLKDSFPKLSRVAVLSIQGMQGDQDN